MIFVETEKHKHPKIVTLHFVLYTCVTLTQKMHAQLIIADALDMMLCFKMDLRISSRFLCWFGFFNIYIELTIDSLQDVYL